MDSRPPSLLLFLAGLLRLWHCGRGQPLFLIDKVSLTTDSGGSVKSGTPVTLTCKVVVNHDNSFNLTHTFQILKDGLPVRSVATTDDTVAYRLDPARAADSGNYECRVGVRDKSSLSAGQKLNVKGLQTPTLTLSKNNVYKSEQFSATCGAPDEKGPLVFYFYQKLPFGSVATLKHRKVEGNSWETKLELQRSGSALLYCNYNVTLVSESRCSDNSDAVAVLVRDLHINLSMTVLPSTHVYEGDLIEVSCQVKSPVRDIDVFLTRERIILHQAPHSLNFRFRVKEGDPPDLVCKAHWETMKQETNQTISIKSLFSHPRLTLQPRDVVEGDIFTLTCSVTVYVPDKVNNGSMKFSIYKENKKVSSSQRYSVMARASTDGNYTCKVEVPSDTNFSFVKESKISVVKAKEPVSPPAMSVVSGTLVLGRSFQLLCRSDRGTPPITYSLQGPQGLHQVQVVKNLGTEAVFNISGDFTISDIKTLRCKAENNEVRPAPEADALQLLRSTRIIEPVSKPVLTIKPDSGSVSEGDTVILLCSVQRGSPSVTFTWYHQDTQTLLFTQKGDKLRGSFSISEVEGKHRGGYYCRASNTAHDTKQSHTVLVRVTMASWKKALLAVLCSLLLLLLLICCIFRRRIVRLTRRRRPELCTKAASTKAERLSLTQAEANQAVNVTPGIMGKSVWSEHISGSESDDQNSVASPENQEPRYTEVPSGHSDPNGVPEKQTDAVCGRDPDPRPGVPQQADAQGSVEYAQLNHDTDHHGDGGAPDDGADEADGGADVDDLDPAE